jgi:hypothetical protein
MADMKDFIRALADRVQALEERAAEIDRKDALVRAAEGSWTPACEVQGTLILRNGAGANAAIPVALAYRLKQSLELDAEFVEFEDEEDEEADMVGFVDQHGKELARFPRALWIGLDRALAGWTPAAARRGGPGLAAGAARDFGSTSPAGRAKPALAPVSHTVSHAGQAAPNDEGEELESRPAESGPRPKSNRPRGAAKRRVP